MSGKPAQIKKTEDKVQKTAERLAENAERLAALLKGDIIPYDEAIEQGYAPIDVVAELVGCTRECARGYMRRRNIETVRSKTPGKRLPELFYRMPKE